MFRIDPMTSTFQGDAPMVARIRQGIVHLVSADCRARRLARLAVRRLGYRVQSFAGARAFLAQGLVQQPDCLVLDCALPDDAAPDVQWAAQHAPVRIPVVLMGDAKTSVYIAVQAMKSGAVDFLCAPVATAELEAAIASAVAVAGVWRAEDMRRTRANVLAARLTPRERAVFALVLEGRLNKQIAADLDSQEATIKVHRSRLMRKLEVRSLAELLAFGRELDCEVLCADPRHRAAPSAPRRTSVTFHGTLHVPAKRHDHAGVG